MTRVGSQRHRKEKKKSINELLQGLSVFLKHSLSGCALRILLTIISTSYQLLCCYQPPPAKKKTDVK